MVIEIPILLANVLIFNLHGRESVKSYMSTIWHKVRIFVLNIVRIQIQQNICGYLLKVKFGVQTKIQEW